MNAISGFGFCRESSTTEREEFEFPPIFGMILQSNKWIGNSVPFPKSWRPIRRLQAKVARHRECPLPNHRIGNSPAG
jgi:hypothetical protein